MEQNNMLSDGNWTYIWEHGRELGSMTNGSATWTFAYNGDGLRTSRTNGSTTYGYVYNGSSLSQMTVGSNTLYFAYDASGTPMSVTYNGTNYYYATNIQGDVTAILNTSGTAVVQYTYDAWGKLLTATGSMASTLGEHNPLRYRGYVYDTETTLYYLQSRYYDPEMGRFLNADVYISTGQDLLGNNMFAYCCNGPVEYADYSGTDAIVLFDENNLGHIGMMVQDEEGTWWHFYWGTKGVLSRVLCAINVDVKPYTWCVRFSGNPSSLDEINSSKQYGGNYDVMHYFQGDFSTAIETIQNCSGKYNLYSNNCSQVSLKILAAANDEYSELFSAAAKYTIPQKANTYLNTHKNNFLYDNMFYYEAIRQKNNVLWEVYP